MRISSLVRIFPLFSTSYFSINIKQNSIVISYSVFIINIALKYVE